MRNKVLFLAFFILFSNCAFSQVDWKHQVVRYVSIASTPNNPDQYVWHEESDTRQGIHINLSPTEIVNIYVEKGNAKICFGHYTGINTWSHLIIYFDINVNNQQNYTNLYQGSATTNVIWDCSSIFSTLGNYNLKIRFMVAGYSTMYYREYNIRVVPKSDKLFFDQYGNSMRLWKGNSLTPYPLLLSPGFDAYNTKPEQYYRYAGSELFDCLLNAGFDVYVLNYKYNPQDLRNNAAVYSSAIIYISYTWNNSQNIVAAGISMGGVISRYALAKAEHFGNPLPVDKWLSLDAPHKGAYISKKLQYFIKENTSNDFDKYAGENDAAKILLIYNAYDPHPDEDPENEEFNNNKGPIHTAFYDELNSLNGNGYPHLTYNIGVSFSTNSPNPYTGKWLNIKAGILKNEDFDLKSQDKVSGSYLPKLNIDPSLILPLGGLIWATLVVTQYQYPTFISHESSLDLVNGVSKFDKTIIPSVTGFHDVVPSELIQEILNAIIKEDLYLQNQMITDNKHFMAKKTIYSGNNVTIYQPSGDFIIESGGNVIFQSGEKIVLKRGFYAKTGSSFRAYIDPPYFSCTQPPLPLSVYISGPAKGYNNIEYTWTAHVSGGIQPYTYLWHYSLDGQNYNNVIGTTPSITEYLPYNNDLYLKVTVTSSDNQIIVDYFHTINMDASKGNNGDLKDSLLNSNMKKRELYGFQKLNDNFSTSNMNNFIDIEIYPNPSSGLINIDFINIFSESFKISFINSLGIKVKTCSVYSNKNKIDLSILPKGMYLIKIETQEKSVFYSKISIQ